LLKSNEILYSKGKNDECVTPTYGVTPIVSHVKSYADFCRHTEENKLIVWCPFDTAESEFVKQIGSGLSNVEVTHSHIDNEENFYNYEPSKWDIIVSNPPFTNKRGIFERALNFNKPFALLMSNTWLNDSAPKQLFNTKDLQLLMFDKRIRYIMPDGSDNSKITFSSSYFCWGFLHKQIIMEKIVYK
jgi:hypothetical protein